MARRELAYPANTYSKLALKMPCNATYMGKGYLPPDQWEDYEWDDDGGLNWPDDDDFDDDDF